MFFLFTYQFKGFAQLSRFWSFECSSPTLIVYLNFLDCTQKYFFWGVGGRPPLRYNFPRISFYGWLNNHVWRMYFKSTTRKNMCTMKCAWCKPHSWNVMYCHWKKEVLFQTVSGYFCNEEIFVRVVCLFLFSKRKTCIKFQMLHSTQLLM